MKIFHLAFEPRQASASTVSAAFGPAVLLNSTADRRERTYSLAHELFHILTWGRLDIHLAEMEVLADRFADCFLLPNKAVRQAITSHSRDGKVTFRELDLIAHGFDVPLEALLRRLEEVCGMPKDIVHQTILRVQTAGFSGREDRAQIPSSRPRRFVALAEKAYEEGKLSLGRLAEYLGISRQEATKQFFHNGKESIADEEIFVASP